MENINSSDPLNLVEQIVFEVKSQGLFDRFRKECISDVDTKPAYQNLKQRVENSVSSFLQDQKWSPELNRNHVREKLRKHITESAFLDTGVERIVDQVVNPKISAVFLPQVEEVICKYLGIDKLPYKTAPDLKFLTNSASNGELKIETDLLPTDLEAVSPDSDRSKSLHNSTENLSQMDDTNDLHNESADKLDDFESPPFEPLEGRPSSALVKEESNDSHLSGISGLTSQDSISSDKEEENNEKPIDESNSALIERINQDSQLSQVSSNSHLSIITHSNESTSPKLDMFETARMAKSDEEGDGRVDGLPTTFDMIKDEIKKEKTNEENVIINDIKVEMEIDKYKQLERAENSEIKMETIVEQKNKFLESKPDKIEMEESSSLEDMKIDDSSTTDQFKIDELSSLQEMQINMLSPKIERPDPSPEELCLKIEETILKTEELIPNIDDSTPDEAILSKIEDSSNNIEGQNSKTEEPNGKMEEPNSKIEEPSPLMEELSPKTIKLSPKIEDAGIKIDELSLSEEIKINEESSLSENAILDTVKKEELPNIKIEETSNSASNQEIIKTPKDESNEISSSAVKSISNTKSRDKDYRSHDRKYKESRSQDRSSDKSREKNRTSSSKHYSSSSSRDTGDRNDDKNLKGKSRNDEKDKNISDGKDKERSRDYYKSSKPSSSSSSKYTSSSSSTKDKEKERRSDHHSSSSKSSRRDKDDKYSSRHRTSSKSEDTKRSNSNNRSDRDKEKSSHTSSSSSGRDKSRKTSSSSTLNVEKRKDKKQDDHSSSRDKNRDKRRSTDRDSNDGSNSGHGFGGTSSNRTETISSTTNSSEQSSSTSSPTSSSSQNSGGGGASGAVGDTAQLNKAAEIIIPVVKSPIHKVHKIKPDGLKLAPVILDEMITDGNMEILIRPPIIITTTSTDSNNGRDSGIELSEFGNDEKLIIQKKKPKFASNIFEAKKLMKIRKKMERDLKRKEYNDDDNENLYYFPEKNSKYRINTDCLIFAKAYIDECEKLIASNLPYNNTAYMLNCAPEFIEVAQEKYDYVCKIDNNKRIKLNGKNNNNLTIIDNHQEIDYLFHENNKFNYDNNFLQSVNNSELIDIEEDVYLEQTAAIKRKSEDGFNNNKKMKKDENKIDVINTTSPITTTSPLTDEITTLTTATTIQRKIRQNLNLKANQRYSSDDLYKPRNIFCGSSRRRRGLDTSTNDVTL